MSALGTPGPKFYSIEELRGALVVDSEALVYGRLGGARFTQAGVFLEVYVEYSVESLAPDKEKLEEALRRQGVRVPETLEDLVATARSLGLEIPVQKTRVPLRLLKGLVPVEHVELIDLKTVETSSGQRRREAVVLLSEPREAKYRGAPVGQPPPRHPTPSMVLGKLVVSRTRGILGRVAELVIGPREPGIRVTLTGAAPGYVNWAGLLRRIRREDSEAYEKLASIIDYHREPRIGLERLEEIRSLLSKHAPRYAGLLDEYIVREERRTGVHDVPWSSVVRLGEIVLVE